MLSDLEKTESEYNELSDYRKFCLDNLSLSRNMGCSDSTLWCSAGRGQPATPTRGARQYAAPGAAAQRNDQRPESDTLVRLRQERAGRLEFKVESVVSPKAMREDRRCGALVSDDDGKEETFFNSKPVVTAGQVGIRKWWHCCLSILTA